MKRFFLICCLSIVCDIAVASIERKPWDESCIYYINGKQVTAEKFNEVFSKMEEVDGTWYCKKQQGGGSTGYQMKDKNGKLYDYNTTVNEDKCTVRITRKKKE